MNLPNDDEIDRRFKRCIDLPTLDDASSNWRCERKEEEEDHPLRNSYPRSCNAHKKWTVAALAWKILAPLDSQYIRIALSLEGGKWPTLIRQVRLLMVEQFKIVPIGSCSAEANAHRTAVYDTFLSGKSPKVRGRRKIVETLWNGNIHR